MKYTRKQLEKLTTKELMKIRNDLKQDFKQSEKVDKRIMSRFDETTISNNELNSNLDKEIEELGKININNKILQSSKYDDYYGEWVAEDGFAEKISPLVKEELQIINNPKVNPYGGNREVCDEDEVELYFNNGAILICVPIDEDELYLDGLSIGMSFFGEIPEAIGELTNLRKLVLSRHSLSGEIPPSIWNLQNLEEIFLYMAGGLSGNLGGNDPDNPTGIGKLTNLTELNLGWQNFGDDGSSFPREIANCESLEKLEIYGCKWEEPVSNLIRSTKDLPNLSRINSNASKWYGQLPSEIGDYPSLITFGMNGTPGLTGEIPSEIGNLNTLRYLNLDYSNINGEIPSEMGNLTNLGWFSCASCNLIGEIPPEIYDCPLCTIQLAANNLTGSIPEEIENLNLLATTDACVNFYISLGIYSDWGIRHYYQENMINKLSDGVGTLRHVTWFYAGKNLIETIPSTIGGMVRLEVLDLYSNYELTGQLPSEIGNLRNLRYLNFVFCNITGELPLSIGNLTNLETIKLQSNQITGIPYTIGNLTNLEELSLPLNRVSEIPPEMGNLTNLTVLGLSGNNIESFPDNLGRLHNLERLYCVNNNLTELPSTFSNLENLELLSLSGNQFLSIPTEISFMKNLSELYMTGPDDGDDYPKLSGLIPDISNTKLNRLNIQRSELTGFENINGIDDLKEQGYLNNLYMYDHQICPPYPETLSATELFGSKYRYDIPSDCNYNQDDIDFIMDLKNMAPDKPIEFYYPNGYGFSGYPWPLFGKQSWLEFDGEKRLIDFGCVIGETYDPDYQGPEGQDPSPNIWGCRGSDNVGISGPLPLSFMKATHLKNLALINNGMYEEYSGISGLIPQEICEVDWYTGLPSMLLHNNSVCEPYPTCIDGVQIGYQDISNCMNFGCTDSRACNYNSYAGYDDGTCYYPDECRDGTFSCPPVVFDDIFNAINCNIFDCPGDIYCCGSQPGECGDRCGGINNQYKPRFLMVDNEPDEVIQLDKYCKNLGYEGYESHINNSLNYHELYETYGPHVIGEENSPFQSAELQDDGRIEYMFDRLVYQDGVYWRASALMFRLFPDDNYTDGNIISQLSCRPSGDYPSFCPEIVYGCTDKYACNYTEGCDSVQDNYYCFDDGSCEYGYECQNGILVCDESFCPIYGCMNEMACNYNPEATVPDRSCIMPTHCWDGSQTCDECPELPLEVEPIRGCMDGEACNYNPNATFDDGSCEYADYCYDCVGGCLCEFDECGVCGGIGPNHQCWNGELVCNEVDCIPKVSAGTIVDYDWGLGCFLVDSCDDVSSLNIWGMGSAPDECCNYHMNDQNFYCAFISNWEGCEYFIAVECDSQSFDLPSTQTSYQCMYQDPPQTGCTDPNANNYNPEAEVDDGSCEYDGVQFNLTLNNGQNLISFPISLDNYNNGDLNSVFTDSRIIGIIGDGVAASKINGVWQGSLNEINPTSSYYVLFDFGESGSETFTYIGTPLNNEQLIYNLRSGTGGTGTTLVSFPFMQSNVPIGDVIDSSYSDSGQIIEIVGEGVASSYVNGEWVGALANVGLSSGEGYRIRLYNDNAIEFQWNSID